MRQITITTSTGTVTYPLAKGADPSVKDGLFIIETKSDGTKTVPLAAVLDSEITDVTNAGKLDSLKADVENARAHLASVAERVFAAARVADDVNDSGFQRSLADYMGAHYVAADADASVKKYEHTITRNRAAFQRRKAEKNAAATAAAENDGTHAFNADEPIGTPSAPAPITAKEAKTKKTKKS